MNEHTEVNVFTLGNGLRVVHSPNTATPMVAVNVMYNAGARDERPGLTGLAHLFEHLMFGGSANVPDFDSTLTAAGGSNNAFTGSDFTNFYDMAPAQNAETLFYLESDRMLAPSLSQETLDVQRKVVIEEFKETTLNRPYGDLYQTLRPLLYGDSHPYSWPVIGKDISHIENIRRSDLTDWFDRHYSPDNAIMAVTGNITLDRTRQLSEKWFGGIAPRPVPPRCVPDIAAPAEPRIVTVTGRVPSTLITAAYLMDPYGTDGYLAADAITDVLSAGRASRFYRRLMAEGDGLFTEAEACITGHEHQGMLLLTARLSDEKTDPMEALGRLIAEARSVVTEGVSETDLQRLKNRQQSNEAMARLDYLNYGYRLALAEYHGERHDTMLRRYLGLRTDMIVDTADKIFNSTAPAVVIYRPEGL